MVKFDAVEFETTVEPAGRHTSPGPASLVKQLHHTASRLQLTGTGETGNSRPDDGKFGT